MACEIPPAPRVLLSDPRGRGAKPNEGELRGGVGSTFSRLGKEPRGRVAKHEFVRRSHRQLGRHCWRVVTRVYVA